MAIAFRAAGARLKTDISGVGSPQNVALPPGHVANDVLLLVVETDDNAGPLTPAGWSVISSASAGTSSPALPRPRVKVFARVDTGSLGANVAVSFNTSNYPAGNPAVIACVLAWSGCDTVSPIGEWGFLGTTTTAAAQAHPQITTTAPLDWLVTIRGQAFTGLSTTTFTNSVGTDSERVDDSAQQALSLAVYDSNTGLSTGLQTQRTTTASDPGAFGSVMISIALRAAGVGGTVIAQAITAFADGVANDATSPHLSGPWDRCATLPVYTFGIDWNGDGDFADPNENTTSDILSGGVSISYGRDQSRQLSPSKIGSTSFSVNNTSRRYSPDYVASPLFGDLDPARPMQGSAFFNGVSYPLCHGLINDYNVHADRSNRTVDFTFSDGLSLLDGFPLSTPVLFSQRTGDLVNYILDQAGWTGGRDIDPGATIVPFWWAEGINALPAIQDLVKSEGPPSIAYVGPDNTFIFRDRHHRLLRASSVTAQATFAAKMVDCAAPAVTGLHFTEPFDYAHGWRDIVNSVTFSVAEREVDPLLSAVWTTTDVLSLSNGESRVIAVSTTDPFVNAVTPVVNTDFMTAGAGSVSVQLSQVSGQSSTITLLAVGGGVVVSGLQLRAQSIPVARTIQVSQRDTASISDHGEKTFPDSAPWADAQDAFAITSMILLHYAQRRPTVQMRIVAQDGEHYFQIIQRMISDRIHITNAEAGIDDDFFIENITHQIDRMNQTGLPPVHSAVFGCEKDISITSNPFRFDVRGSGFDDGVFDPIGSDNPDSVFIFDDPDNGMFDVGAFGT